MAEYIDKNESVDESYLQNWYIDSVDEAGTPHWTEEHIEELVKDFIVIPIETPAADVEPVVHAKWIPQYVNRFGLTNIFVCSECNKTVHTIRKLYKLSYLYCPNCGARMDGEE